VRIMSHVRGERYEPTEEERMVALEAARAMGIDPERVNVVREPVWSWRRMDHVDRLWLEVQGITPEEYEDLRGVARERHYLLMPHDSGYLSHPRPPNYLRRWKLSPEAYPEVERRAWSRLGALQRRRPRKG
jgi:hypothetical protein